MSRCGSPPVQALSPLTIVQHLIEAICPRRASEGIAPFWSGENRKERLTPTTRSTSAVLIL